MIPYMYSLLPYIMVVARGSLILMRYRFECLYKNGFLLYLLAVPDGSVVLVTMQDSGAEYTSDVATELASLIGRDIPIVEYRGKYSLII